MKLRLVREDGTPATIDDVFDAFNAIVIDGVPMGIVAIEGPAVHRIATSRVDHLRVTLAYGNNVETVFDEARSSRAVTYVKDVFSCPFPRRS